MDKSTSEYSKVVDANVVARRAVQVCRYMTKRLAFADITVMAGQAVAGFCARVIKRRSCKVDGVMANVAFLIIGSGRYMIREFTDTYSIVVARCAVASSDTDMIIGASAKGSRGMASTAILDGRHVCVERGGKRHTARRTRAISNMTGDATITYDASVIDAKCWNKTFGIMARSTIGTGFWVGGHCGAFSGRVNTIAIVVTRFTRLCCRIK